MDRSLPDKMKSGKKNGASRLIKEGALRRFVTTPARSNKSSNNLLSEAKIRFVYLPMGGARHSWPWVTRSKQRQRDNRENERNHCALDG